MRLWQGGGSDRVTTGAAVRVRASEWPFVGVLARSGFLAGWCYKKRPSPALSEFGRSPCLPAAMQVASWFWNRLI
jgi:hypothetical protein